MARSNQKKICFAKKKSRDIQKTPFHSLFQRSYCQMVHPKMFYQDKKSISGSFKLIEKTNDNLKSDKKLSWAKKMPQI